MSGPFGKLLPAVVGVVVFAAVIGASVYYLGAAPPAVSTTSETSVSSASSSAATSSPQGGGQTTSSLGAQLGIESTSVSHLLSTTHFSATCGVVAPAQGASYIEVTNSGSAPAAISSVSFSYIDMTPVTDSGAPSGDCTVGAGATEYITFMGIGQDRAYTGVSFTVTVNWGDSGYAYAAGTFS